jgi:hypothetical protein
VVALVHTTKNHVSHLTLQPLTPKKTGTGLLANPKKKKGQKKKKGKEKKMTLLTFTGIQNKIYIG